MKVQSHVKLDGPLSRNRALRNLKTGDTLTVRVLERIDRFTADIDFKGNRLRAHFQNGVPSDDKVLLQIMGNRSGTLVFSLPGRSEVMELPDSLLKLPGFDLYLASMSDDVSDIFSLVSKFLLKNNSTSLSSYLFFSRLLKKYNARQVSLLSRFAAPKTRADSIFFQLFDLIGDTAALPEEDEADIQRFLDALDKEEAEQLIESALDQSRKTLVFMDEDRPVIIETAQSNDCLTARFELSNSGCVQLVCIEKGEHVEADIFIENEEFLGDFISFREELDRRLGSQDKRVRLYAHSLKDSIFFLRDYVKARQMHKTVDFKA